jgi:hypothetical protein
MQDRSNHTGDDSHRHPLKSLTAAQFMALGGNAIVYIRPIKGAALSELMDEVQVDDEQEFQLVVSADGSPLLVADSEESVAEWLSDKDLGIVALH